MAELLTIALSNFKYFIGTLILIGWIGIVISISIGLIGNIIRKK